MKRSSQEVTTRKHLSTHKRCDKLLYNMQKNVHLNDHHERRGEGENTVLGGTQEMGDFLILLLLLSLPRQEILGDLKTIVKFLSFFTFFFFLIFAFNKAPQP